MTDITPIPGADAKTLTISPELRTVLDGLRKEFRDAFNTAFGNARISDEVILPHLLDDNELILAALLFMYAYRGNFTFEQLEGLSNVFATVAHQNRPVLTNVIGQIRDYLRE
jgi:hypothetical protein